MREKIIYGSDQTQGGAQFGRGTYMTSIPPSADKETIAWNNYDDGKQIKYFSAEPTKGRKQTEKHCNAGLSATFGEGGVQNLIGVGGAPFSFFTFITE